MSPREGTSFVPAPDLENPGLGSTMEYKVASQPEIQPSTDVETKALFRLSKKNVTLN